MSEFVFKLPDLGEGAVEAEIVEWHVGPGDVVAEGDLVADVLTEKANVEVPAPVSGTVLRTSGTPGDLIPVGAELIAIETSETTRVEPAQTSTPEPEPDAEPVAAPEPPPEPAPEPVADSAPEQLRPEPKVITSPAIRRYAKEAGIDLAMVAGSGPRGRILRSDLETLAAGTPHTTPIATGAGRVEEIKVIGVRRIIANRMQASKREIPHFAYVEEVDVTALESLRVHLNADRGPRQPSLTYLPFIALALIRALREFPQCNAHFDPEQGLLKRYEDVHLGIATQTTEGLKVPVVHNANARKLWGLASEIARVAEAARDNTASRADLTGSTFTITSLGRMGGIVTTPVINAPEVGILGVNKAVKRPVVVDDAVTVRLMMNLSSCFDHRFVDGFDAASLIQSVKAYLEVPATIFIDQ
ncbi:MAG: 2-oxo acid dehydrogenase subunit E2 [Gammaproteobacteria bacterium]|nr:2-oxo acid dehydrogenase subunit E2 [Gammaproteobacteria bacterium]